jgi:hypothetical protein
MDDDEQAALAHQAELECKEWEEIEAEYTAWLALQEPWWRMLDNDPNWIREHT